MGATNLQDCGTPGVALFSPPDESWASFVGLSRQMSSRGN